MSKQSRQQTRGAASQWNTINELMKLAPDSLDRATLNKVKRDAQEARRSVVACSPTSDNKEMDDLTNQIDTVIEGSSAA